MRLTPDEKKEALNFKQDLTRDICPQCIEHLLDAQLTKLCEGDIRECVGLENCCDLNAKVEEAKKQEAKDIFDRLEDNLFYENNGKEIEISFTKIGWEALKSEHKALQEEKDSGN